MIGVLPSASRMPPRNTPRGRWPTPTEADFASTRTEEGAIMTRPEGLTLLHSGEKCLSAISGNWITSADFRHPLWQHKQRSHNYRQVNGKEADGVAAPVQASERACLQRGPHDRPCPCQRTERPCLHLRRHHRGRADGYQPHHRPAGDAPQGHRPQPEHPRRRHALRTGAGQGLQGHHRHRGPSWAVASP